MYISRIAEKKFSAISSFFKVVLLTGPRQVGKTTMLRHLAQSTGRTYATLDDPAAQHLAKEDPVGFFQNYPPPVLVDEVQYAPELFPVIKLLADRSDHPGQFWLTGSQHYAMLRNVQESLAGRIGIMSLAGMTQGERQQIPLSDLEFGLDALRQRTQTHGMHSSAGQVAEHIWRGVMPGAPDSAAADMRSFFFESYLQSYLMRDIAQLGNVQSLGQFADFMAACAALISQQLNLTNLAQAAGISVPTARKWLDLLVGMGIVYLLRPFAGSTLKRLTKRPKLYFTDTGLAAYLTAWPTPDTLWKGAMSGAFFENYVLMELLANLNASSPAFTLSYYRDGHGKEIDLVLERGRLLHPLEIKQSAAPRRQEVRKFELIERSGLERGSGGIICMAPEPMYISEQDSFIPAPIL